MEVVVATLVMAAAAIPLFQLFQGGIRATRATIHEIQGTHLAAEIAEQVETIPFDILERLAPSGSRTLASQQGTLSDGLSLDGSNYSFHLSPLPGGFERKLILTRTQRDLILAEANVSWKRGSLPARTILFRRFLARDSLFP
jgi:hypothetical protein